MHPALVSVRGEITNERYYSGDERGGAFQPASRAANSSNMAPGHRRNRLGRYGRLDMFFGLWIRQANGASNLRNQFLNYCLLARPVIVNGNHLHSNGSAYKIRLAACALGVARK
jgi:hypothetical protein